MCAATTYPSDMATFTKDLIMKTIIFNKGIMTIINYYFIVMV